MTGVQSDMVRLDWPALGAALLDRPGKFHAPTCCEGVLAPEAGMRETERCRAFWEQDELFRRRIIPWRGMVLRGRRLRLFRRPVAGRGLAGARALREELYRQLAPVADEAMARLGREACYPPDHAAYRAECHAAGQTKPTPLLLRYREGGYNRLHRDLYGALAFPFQATFLLSQPGADFTGGEFLLVENRMRMQAMGEAVPLERGDMVVFPVRDRPVAGRRGPVRAEMRHGVSRIRSGERFTLGIIFHDAA